MICRQLTYKGNFSSSNLEQFYKIARRIELAAVIKKINDQTVELVVEGDPSMIKLLQHQIERSLKDVIIEKQIISIPFRHISGINFIHS